ncbi:MAG: tetratricopeptide repeat protein [Treponema sp.]|jgi:tetratricopeptide (TPR) repeat protein|nr:tetratricopeptide repeat protein [Treponema sp.]
MKRPPWRGVTVTLCILAALLALSACATRGAASAEEYYSLGMAYFEMGKYPEAEKWLNRARTINKTRIASEYNLGRIAFETGRYTEALEHFERILKRDPQNITALKAAAYSCIKTGALDDAALYYDRVLALAPESADDGYNYALVLYAMERYDTLAEVLSRYSYALEENKDLLLLYARSQKATGKVEAVDTYAKWLANNNDAKVRVEYGQVLEGQEQYAKALTEYKTVLESLQKESADPKWSDVQYAIARLLLTADPNNADGVTRLKEAVDAGFADTEALNTLLADSRLKPAGKTAVQEALAAIAAAAPPAEEAPPAGEAPPPAGAAAPGQ